MMRAIVLLLLAVAVTCQEPSTGEIVAEKEVPPVHEEAEEVETQKDDEKAPERPAIHLPSIPSFQIIPQIQFPGYDFPAIPLPQLPQLPSFALPQLPTLPRPFKRETLYETKTVYIEHTHRVTRHPVCVTAYVPKPACHYDAEVKGLDGNQELQKLFAAERAKEILPTSVTTELPASTRIISTFENNENEYDSGAIDSSESYDDQMATYRDGRYLVPHPVKRQDVDSTKVATEPLSSDHLKIKHQEEHLQVPHGYLIHGHHGSGAAAVDVNHHHHDLAHDGEDHGVVHGLLKVKHIVTKTLVVTNVQKVIDHHVTATLIAKNCLPSEYIIPHCSPNHGLGKSPDDGKDYESDLKNDENPVTEYDDTTER